MKLFLKGAQYEPKSPAEHVEGVSFILPLEHRDGYVFLMAWVTKKNAQTEDLIQLLHDQSLRLTESFGKDANAQHRFEQFLGSLNENIAQSVRDGRVLFPIEQFHAAVGIVCDGQMFLSGTGELTALFLHRKPNQRYQVFNLFRSIQTEQALPSWEKPFAVILDGDLEGGDAFCVSNKDLQRVIAVDDLNSILTTLPPKSATEKIRQYFAHNDGMLLIVFQAENTERSTPQTFATPRGNVSIDSMVRTQEETTLLLEDQQPHIGSFLWKKVRNLWRQYTGKSRLLSDLSKSDAKWKTFWRMCVLVARTTWKVVRFTAKKIMFAVLFVSDKQKRANAIQSILDTKHRLRSFKQQLVDRWKHLDKKTKFSVSGAVGAFVVLMIGLGFLTTSHLASKEQKRFEKQVSTIEETIEQASGALIYKDENQARVLFKQAQDLLSALPKNKPDREARAQKIQNEIDVAMNELRKIVMIPNPIVLGDVQDSAQGTTGTAMVTSGSDIFVAGSDQRVYQFDRLQKKFTVLTANPLSSPIAHLRADEGNIFAFDANRNLTEIKKGATEATPLPLTWDHQNWKDVVAYANRLYVLQSSPQDTDSQIIRFNQSGETFGDGKNWITSRTSPLTNAVSLTIDGALYVLEPNGIIKRFENGSETGWNAELIEPAFETATNIWTLPQSAYLYVLEPARKRLVVFEKKTGAFVVQYTSDAFTDLKDVSVDEKGYTIYLLGGSKLYSIAASHLTQK